MNQLTQLDISGLIDKTQQNIDSQFVPVSSLPFRKTIPTYDEIFALNYLYWYAPNTFAEIKFILNDLKQYSLIPDLSNKGKIRILDLGCGSGTGSLAIVDHLRIDLALTPAIYVYLIDESLYQLEVAKILFKESGLSYQVISNQMNIFENTTYCEASRKFDFVIISKALNECMCKTTTSTEEEIESLLSAYIDYIFNTYLEEDGILILAETAEYAKETNSFGKINWRKTFNKIILNTKIFQFVILPRVCAGRITQNCGDIYKDCDWWRYEKINFRGYEQDIKFMYYCFSKNKKDIKKKYSYVMYGGKRSPQWNTAKEQLVCSVDSFGYSAINPPKLFEEKVDP